MSDDELVAALQAIFAADDPDDGIDRSDGYGEDYRIESVRVAPSDDGLDDLEITVRYPRKMLPHRRTVVSRLLFDRTWRHDSDLDDPAAYAAYVVARWPLSVVSPESSGAARHRAAAEAWVPDAETSWQALLDDLRSERHGVVERDGVIEVPDDDQGTCFVHVTPAQWRTYVVGWEAVARRDSGEGASGPGDGPVNAYGRLADLIDARWDDEQHIVFFRGDLHQSIRAELPPVRSMILRDTDVPAGGDWFAGEPDEDDGRA